MTCFNKKCTPAYIFLSLLILIGGCGSPAPQKFYTLNSDLYEAGGKTIPARSASSYNVVVGPVVIPALVDRPQIVLNSAPNRVTISEQSRWAEPLKESIPRVMAGDLAQLLHNDRVFAHPQSFVSDPDFRVLINVYRFDSTQGEAAVIDLQWTIRTKNDGAQLSGRTFKREPANGNDFDSLVAAHERALAAVSQEIAAAIDQIKPRR
jgi:uncharacterized protein